MCGFCVAACEDVYATYTGAAATGPAWSEAPGSVQAGAGEPGLRCFHPESCTLGVEQVPATTWLLAHQTGRVGGVGEGGGLFMKSNKLF